MEPVTPVGTLTVISGQREIESKAWQESVSLRLDQILLITFHH